VLQFLSSILAKVKEFLSCFYRCFESKVSMNIERIKKIIALALTANYMTFAFSGFGG